MSVQKVVPCHGGVASSSREAIALRDSPTAMCPPCGKGSDTPWDWPFGFPRSQGVSAPDLAVPWQRSQNPPLCTSSRYRCTRNCGIHCSLSARKRKTDIQGTHDLGVHTLLETAVAAAPAVRIRQRCQHSPNCELQPLLSYNKRAGENAPAAKLKHDLKPLRATLAATIAMNHSTQQDARKSHFMPLPDRLQHLQHAIR